MREVSTKILLGFLVAGLVIPAVLFVRPKKAEALLSLAACFAAKGVAAAQATASAAPGAVLSVSTSDIANTVQSGTSPAGTDWRSCFLGSLAKIIAKTLLHTFTQSIVKWINTGFEGSPSFVTNPEGFLNDVADQTIGRVIEDISPLLCAPFKLDIRFALGLNLSLNSREEVHCRLSDVISNVRGAYDSFVTGTIGSGNLSNWIHIAGTQSNNAYGAYIATTDIMSARIVSATGQQIKLLDWGNGFKSWRSCEKWGPDVKSADGKTTRKGACIKEGPIKTPGSIIQDQTTGALGSTLRELELASEIDEVVGALINRLLVKAMTGAGGLLGTTKGDSSNGGISSIEALMTDPDAAVRNADTKAPVGINCRLRYYPATKEQQLPTGSKIYVPNDDDTPIGTQVWTDNLGDRTIIVPDGQDTSAPIVKAYYVNRNGEIITDARYIKSDDPTPTPITRGAGQAWETYFNTVRDGCSNEWNTLITNASTGALATTPGAGGATPGTPPPPAATTQTSKGNVALHKKATQSSTFVLPYGSGANDWFQNSNPKNAVDGNQDASYFFGTAATSYGKEQWWMVDLMKDGTAEDAATPSIASIDEIRSIKVFGAAGGTYPRYGLFTPYVGKWLLAVTSEPPPKTAIASWLRANYNGNTVIALFEKNGRDNPEVGSPLITTINQVISKDKKARYVVIAQDPTDQSRGNQDLLAIAEVEVYGTQTRTDEASGGTPPEPPAFAITASPLTKLFTSPESSINFDTWRLSFLPNKNESGISFRAKFFNCTGTSTTPNLPCTYKTAPESFLNDFSSLAITYTNGDMTRTKNAIRVGGASGYIYNTDSQNPGSGDTVKVEDNGASFFFADNLSVVGNNPVTVSVTGTLRQKKRFRIVIEAVKDINGAQVIFGTATADFVMP